MQDVLGDAAKKGVKLTSSDVIISNATDGGFLYNDGGDCAKAAKISFDRIDFYPVPAGYGCQTQFNL